MNAYELLEARLVAAGKLAPRTPLNFTLEADARAYASHGAETPVPPRASTPVGVPSGTGSHGRVASQLVDSCVAPARCPSRRPQH